MIYLATILLFMLAVVAIYAIIQTGKNNVITFFLIPLVLVSSIFTGYSIYVLQGTPVNTLPEGEVTVLWAEVQKPNIYFLVRHVDEQRPTYYRMPYTKENAKKMQGMKQKAEEGNPMEGKFKVLKQKGSLVSMDEFTFDRIKRFALPPKEKELKANGVDQGIINQLTR